jgi:hypothetical protein
MDGPVRSAPGPGIVPVSLPMGDLPNRRGVHSPAPMRRDAPRSGRLRTTPADS